MPGLSGKHTVGDIEYYKHIFLVSFDTLQICARDIEDMHEEVLC